MKQVKFLALALGVLLAGAGVNAQQPPPASKAAKPAVPATKAPASEMAREARALELLKATSARLAAARSMTFTAVVTQEWPSQLGPAIAYTPTSEVLLQRSDKLRVVTLGDGPASEFYYDGRTITAFAPAENRGAAHDRCHPEVRLRRRGDLLSVHRPRGRRSVCGDRRWAQARVLHRPVEGGRRNDHRHGGLR